MYTRVYIILENFGNIKKLFPYVLKTDFRKEVFIPSKSFLSSYYINKVVVVIENVDMFLTLKEGLFFTRTKVNIKIF